MIITKTPYRLSLFGGGTDYPAWFENNPSICISAAMANYCYLTVKKLPPFFEYNSRIIYSQIESVQMIDEINHPSAKACLQYLGIDNVVPLNLLYNLTRLRLNLLTGLLQKNILITHVTNFFKQQQFLQINKKNTVTNCSCQVM